MYARRFVHPLAVAAIALDSLYGAAPSVPAALEVFESLVARGADPRDVEALARDGVWRRAR